MNRLQWVSALALIAAIFPRGAAAQDASADHPAPSSASDAAPSPIPEGAASGATSDERPWYLRSAPEQGASPEAVEDEGVHVDEDVDEGEDEPVDEDEGGGLEVLGEELAVDPFVTIVGGAYGQFINNRSDIPDHREDRFTTVALSRLGLRARWGAHVSLVSEFELNAGPYGTSVWEGQAAIQVRNQLLRLEWEGLRVDVGRITDPASLDFFSAYVANLLLTDDLTRFPLLLSGFNRGNGILASYEFFEGFRLNFTVNAGNPTSTTGTVMIGGTFPPFARFYEVPWSNVGRDARGFPTNTFHVLLVSPSVTFEHEYIRAQAQFQYFDANTNTSSDTDAHIDGYNLRLGVQGRIWDGRIRPFANVSRVHNDVVDPTDLGTLSDDCYEAYTAGGGLDVDIVPGTFGVGGQFVWVREQQGDDTILTRYFTNAGASLTFLPGVSVDARYGWSLTCEDHLCGQNEEHRVYLTLRGVLGAAGATGRRP